jgi:hypothetical protein
MNTNPVYYQTNDPVKQEKLKLAINRGLVTETVTPSGTTYQITQLGILVWAAERGM